MTKHPLLSIVLLFLITACTTIRQATTAPNVLPATSLKPIGRTIINEKQQLELISSAAHVGFSFTGDECTIVATLRGGSGHNYPQYEIDGVYQKRIRIGANANEPIVIKAPKNRKHTVWLYKATEAHTGAIAIEKIVGRNVAPIAPPEAPLIEFIGNSITCGAAADPSEVPCGAGQYHDQHNAYAAYGPRVARAVGANFILSSVSGIGIYRTWNMESPSMPQVYEKADFSLGSNKPWNFETNEPAIVSIALGTNDISRGDGKNPRLPFDSSTFVRNYLGFVELVKSKYPKAQIALLSSPMVHNEARTLLQNCLFAVKSGIDTKFLTAKPVALHFFKPMQARGCTGHPNVEDHAILADELLPFFKNILK